MDPNGPYQKELASRKARNGVTYHAIASDFDPIAGTGLVTRPARSRRRPHLRRRRERPHRPDRVGVQLAAIRRSSARATGTSSRWDRGVDHTQFLGSTRVHAVPRAVAARRGGDPFRPVPDRGERAGDRNRRRGRARRRHRRRRRGRRLRRPAPGRADQGGPRQPRARGAPADRRSLPRRRAPGRGPVPRYPPRRPPVDARCCSASCRSRSASRSSSTTVPKAPTAPTRPAPSSSASVRPVSSRANG